MRSVPVQCTDQDDQYRSTPYAALALLYQEYNPTEYGLVGSTCNHGKTARNPTWCRWWAPSEGCRDGATDHYPGADSVAQLKSPTNVPE
jgi:hypothetical protein